MKKRKVKKKRTQSQIGKHSRRKGKSFERFCARYFTAWTSMEWSTTRNSGRFDLKGDIYCVEYPELNMIIECKNRKSYTVHAMLKPTKAFTDLMDECGKKLDNKEQYVVLIIKNEIGIWIANNSIRKGFWRELGFEIDVASKSIKSCCIEWFKIQECITNDLMIEGICFGKNPEIH